MPKVGTLAEVQSKAPEANVTLLAKHCDQFEKTWNFNSQKK